MMPRALSVLALAGVLVVWPLATSAQVTPPRGGQQRQRLELEQRLRVGFQRSIQNQLGLDQEAMGVIQGVMRSFEEERSALARDKASLRYRLRDPAVPEMEEDQARALIQEMVDIQQRELDLYKKEQAELLQVMTPVQLIRFYRMRDDLGQRVQQLRQGRGQEGRAGGIGGLASPPVGGGIGGYPFR